MKELGYEHTRKLEEKIRSVLGCHETIATASKVMTTKVPRPDLESTVVCRKKAADVKHKTYLCAVIDGSDCPLNLSVEKISL